MTFFSAHFPLAVRLSRVGLLALLGSVVLPISTQAQDAPKPQEKFYVSDKVAEELGKIRPIAEAKRWDEALAMVDALIKTSAPNSFDVVTLCNYKFQFLLNKGDNAAAIEPMETSLNLSRQFHYLEPSIELEITQYLAQIYLLESQAKGIKPEQQKQYYSKAAQYAEQVIQRTAAPTSDNYFLYAQVLYYWAMATPEKVDMELMKKAQVQVEKALLMSTRPKEQLWQMLNGILIQQTDYCGSVSGHNTDKSIVFSSFYDELGKAPLIRECPLNFLCKVLQTIPVFDFELFLGQIVAVYADESCLTDGKPDAQKIDPIINVGGAYLNLGQVIGTAFQTRSGNKKSAGRLG